MIKRALREDRRGVIELAYMFVFIITALLLTVMTLSTADMLKKENNQLVDREFEYVGDVVMEAIMDATEAGASGDNVEYSKTIRVPREISGMEYTVEVRYGQLMVEAVDGSGTEMRGVPKMEYEIVGTSNSANGEIIVRFREGVIELV